jgi:hypothetical protein
MRFVLRVLLGNFVDVGLHLPKVSVPVAVTTEQAAYEV